MRARNARSLIRLYSPFGPFPRCSQIFHQSCNSGDQFCGLRANNLSISSSSASSHASYSQWRHHDEESKSVKVAVWWDIENCCIPNGVNAIRVPCRIISALRTHGIRGPISITAFGDITRIPRATQDALCAAGVCLNHVPNCGKNSSDRSLLVDLVHWVTQNPPPVHFFLISGDGDFASVLHRLRMNNYNILLAAGEATPSSLSCAATIMWHWNSLAKGENLSGKHFSHPPDGFHGSWYGHFKGHLENPFPETDQTDSTQSEKTPEVTVESKSTQSPKALGNAIRQVLLTHPEGISVSDLRSELKKNNVLLEKDYFGHKKFSHLLLSMPNILKFRFKPGDPRPLVHGVHERSAIASDLIMTPSIEDDNKPLSLPQKSEDKQITAEELFELHSIKPGEVGYVSKDNVGGLSKQLSENGLNKTEIKDGTVASESGFLTRIFSWCKFWKSSSKAAQEYHSAETSFEESSSLPVTQTEPHNIFLRSHFWDSMESFLGTSKGLDLITTSRTREELMRGLQREGPLVLTALKESNMYHLVGLLIAEKKWVEESLEAYPFKLKLPSRRSCIPSHSKVHELRNTQPISDHEDNIGFPKSISKIQAWLNQMNETARKPLSSRDYEKRFEAEFSKKLEPLSYGYFTVDDLVAACCDKSELNSSLKNSRADALADCKKLLVDFIQHHPHGFNIGLFRPMFFKRYGYMLDYQSLGYPKLASLLQIIPGVRIESSLVLPAEQKPVEDSGAEKEEQGEEKDQSWEELGPLSEEKSAHQTKNKSVSALLEVLDGYYSKPRGDECNTAMGNRRISFVSDMREEDSVRLMGSARKMDDLKLKSKVDPLVT